jgi:hypothetical protein
MPPGQDNFTLPPAVSREFGVDLRLNFEKLPLQ